MSTPLQSKWNDHSIPAIMEWSFQNKKNLLLIEIRIILKSDYENYTSALRISCLTLLKERRQKVSLSFTKKCIKSDNNADSFSEIDKIVNTRLHEKDYVTQLEQKEVPNQLSHTYKEC